jgi:hypothetical protein
MDKKVYLELQDWTYEDGLGGVYYLRNSLGQILAEHFSTNKSYAMGDLIKDYERRYQRNINKKDIVVLAEV